MAVQHDARRRREATKSDLPRFGGVVSKPETDARPMATYLTRRDGPYQHARDCDVRRSEGDGAIPPFAFDSPLQPNGDSHETRDLALGFALRDELTAPLDRGKGG